MKNKNLGDVGLFNNMHICLKPSGIHVALTNDKIALQFAWLTLNSGLLVHVIEGEVGRERNL